jgi:hypothetical protein
MIEYKIFDKDYSPLTLDNYHKVSEVITSALSGIPTDINKANEFIRETRGINGEATHIYYRNRDIRVFIPSNDKQHIKERLEVLAELNLERVQCQ